MYRYTVGILLSILVLFTSSVHAQELPGELVDVGGFRLHLYCVGSGDTTVILESGAGGNGLSWFVVQRELAKTTRVCTYDRAGNGFSDPATTPRTLEQMNLELHTLLTNAGEIAPYILIGHSVGGYLVPAYAAAYPDEVAGLVLVDPTPVVTLPAPTFAQTLALAPVMDDIGRAGNLDVIVKVNTVRFEKLIEPFSIPQLDFDELVARLPLAFGNTNTQAEIMSMNTDEVRAQVLTAYEALPDVPVVLLSARGSVPDEIDFVIEMLEITDITEATRTAMVEFFQGQEDAKNVGQEELAALIDADLVLAETSRHEIMLDAPQLIIDTVNGMLQEVD